ncbi:MAG: hypothetical protein H0V24_05000 [Chloroflexia bacterium]|nr:hypothetical protein [Chloroflexia bacterium]
MRVLVAPLAMVAVAALSYGVMAVVQVTAATEQTPTRFVRLQGATEATIQLKLDAGVLRLAGASMAAGGIVDSSELLRGELDYEDDQAPEIDYELADGGRTGRLVIASPRSSSLWSWSPSEQRWALYVNPAVPTELTVELGTGSAELVLGGMLLTDLNLTAGSGNVMLDLTGDWRTSLSGKLEIGAGDVTIRAPRDTGVRITVEQGVGTVRGSAFTEVDGAYINDAYGSTASEIDIQIEQGAGYIELSEP